MSLLQTAVQPSAPGNRRLLSIDVFRGMAVAGMLLVDYQGDEAAAYAPLKHAHWNGWTPADLVFPSFLFLVGASIVFSFSSRLARGETRRQIALHACKRTVILFAIGLFVQGFPEFHLATWRIEGVIQRIAICYLVAALLFLWTDVRTLVAAAVLCLLGYWALMRLVPVPGLGLPGRDLPVLAPDTNLNDWLDRLLFSGRLYNRTRDPEGVLSTIPATATAVLGVLTGVWLRSARQPGRKALGMFLAGVVGLLLGSAWHLWFPINKNVWSSSYVVFTAGFALVFLSLLYWICEIRDWRGFWTVPFLIFGMNSIVAYILDETMWVPLTYIHSRMSDGRTVPWQQWATDCLAQRTSPAIASLIFAIAITLACWTFLALLYRKRVFVKI